MHVLINAAPFLCRHTSIYIRHNHFCYIFFATEKSHIVVGSTSSHCYRRCHTHNLRIWYIGWLIHLPSIDDI